ncbi:uncharacterized protein LOC103019325 isoform X2 [Balaenoptera acutorostrata]|uniref:Uncharacterized protein LOC103019325 isoform X2 n=1 Tax=Balaenoptera acutorostrata TaxID=9767 RepID=A0ABM3T524_BALAC|nr:uncharacterized protein LOC103019325 isoform X2 [Balaenoptera acutorostrata]
MGCASAKHVATVQNEEEAQKGKNYQNGDVFGDEYRIKPVEEVKYMKNGAEEEQKIAARNQENLEKSASSNVRLKTNKEIPGLVHQPRAKPPTKTGSLSSGHFESLLELPLWLILLPTLGALHQSQIGSLAFHANVSVPSVSRTCLVNSRPHKVPLCLLSALGEAPGMLPGLPERFYKDFAQPSQGQRPGHSCGKTCLCLYPWGSSKPAGL